MFIKRLKEIKECIKVDMKANGYSPKYIIEIDHFINTVIKDGSKCSSYRDYYEKVILTKDIKAISKESQLWKLNFIKQYDETSLFPNSRRCIVNVLNKVTSYYRLNNEFKEIIDSYVEIEMNNFKKETTILNEKRNASNFLYHLQCHGINNVNDIKESDIINYFLDDDGNSHFSASLMKQIRIVLRRASEKNSNISKILLFFPTIPKRNKNIQYLNNEEIVSIRSILNSNDNTITLKDRAIVTLLLNTGLRGCDVRHLKLEDINWENETLNIIQDKTGEPLELPLLTSVGNALYKYITEERPNTGSKYVFLTDDFTHRVLTQSAIYFSISKVMKAAKIRLNKGDRKGSHLFRYNIAISMLENEVARPVISQTLGHSSPKSLESYLNADLKHLKEMAISIDNFPYSVKGVIYD